MSKKADLIVARQHRDYVQLVVDKTGVKPTKLATEIGVAPSTLTRLLNEPDNGKATLRATTLAKLESFSGIPAPTLELPEGERPVQGFREDATPYRETGDSSLSVVIKAIVGNRKNIDPWTIQTRALECAGFMPGDTVLVDLSRMPRAGEACCAQVLDWRGGKADTIMRVYEPPYLVAATFDATLRKPQLVDDQRVIIKGVLLPHRLRATN
ncbi:MAG: hypothetical protein V4673_14355 [Pseudomonadota bacterium]